MKLEDALSTYKPISLSEMDGYELMNRVDTKYIFPAKRLTKLLASISEHYRILEISEVRDFPYCSTYLDTPQNLFFNQHVRGVSNRYKVRYRVYETTGQSYLEVKLKNVKERTIKWRIKNRLISENIDEEAQQFLKSYIQDTVYSLYPVLSNNFYRITLVGVNTKERITFDHNIQFGNRDNLLIDLPFLAIAELKREGYSGESPFIQAMRAMMIRSSSFSKYCVGSAILRALPKSNIIKPKIIQLKRIENENVILTA